MFYTDPFQLDIPEDVRPLDKFLQRFVFASVALMIIGLVGAALSTPTGIQSDAPWPIRALIIGGIGGLLIGLASFAILMVYCDVRDILTRRRSDGK